MMDSNVVPVKYLIFVAGEETSSKRMVYPTSPPMGAPISFATLLAVKLKSMNMRSIMTFINITNCNCSNTTWLGDSYATLSGVSCFVQELWNLYITSINMRYRERKKKKAITYELFFQIQFLQQQWDLSWH